MLAGAVLHRSRSPSPLQPCFHRISRKSTPYTVFYFFRFPFHFQNSIPVLPGCLVFAGALRHRRPTPSMLPALFFIIARRHRSPSLLRTYFRLLSRKSTPHMVFHPTCLPLFSQKFEPCTIKVSTNIYYRVGIAGGDGAGRGGVDDRRRWQRWSRVAAESQIAEMDAGDGGGKRIRLLPQKLPLLQQA